MYGKHPTVVPEIMNTIYGYLCSSAGLLFIHIAKHPSMAEFVLAPNAPAADERQKTALLFFSKQVLTEEQADLQQKFETITQGALQIPFFVVDRSQTFEHKEKRSGPGAHSHMKEYMVEELDLFLPPDLPRDAIKEHVKLELGLEDNVETDAPKHKATATSEHAIRYLQCQKEQTSLHLKACFVYLPSWDQSSLQVHYVCLNVRQKPKSFWSREETLEIDGKRSLMTFSMVKSTAMQVVSALKEKGRDVEKETDEFYQKIYLYDSRSIENASHRRPLPSNTASGADLTHQQKLNAPGSNRQGGQTQQQEVSQQGFLPRKGDAHLNQSQEPMKPAGSGKGSMPKNQRNMPAIRQESSVDGGDGNQQQN